MTGSSHYKRYARGELLADIAAHVIGVACGVCGAVVLMLAAAEASALVIVGTALYAIGLISMVSFSAAYNLWPPSQTKEMLRRLDHAAIFVMIAGTITPFAMLRVGGAWGFGLLTVIWVTATFGVAMKMFFPRRWERLSIVLYVALGLSILIVGEQLAQVVAPSSLTLLAAGAAVYLIGVVFHLWDRLPYQNALWHWLVLLAAALHYWAIAQEVSAAAVTP